MCVRFQPILFVIDSIIPVWFVDINDGEPQLHASHTEHVSIDTCCLQTIAETACTFLRPWQQLFWSWKENPSYCPSVLYNLLR